jgi:hypothetical protein
MSSRLNRRMRGDILALGAFRLESKEFLTWLPFAVGHEKRWTHFGLAIAKTGRSIQAALELVSGERLCNSLRSGDGLPRERTGEKQAKNR